MSASASAIGYELLVSAMALGRRRIGDSVSPGAQVDRADRWSGSPEHDPLCALLYSVRSRRSNGKAGRLFEPCDRLGREFSVRRRVLGILAEVIENTSRDPIRVAELIAENTAKRFDNRAGIFAEGFQGMGGVQSRSAIRIG